ncbi:hypothetical protein [Streptomyces telluris]|uniref:Uncharacterized protein n=1 Tax=Streptomyces telluris TaxID=2720021 RepID=A0A9X2LMS4_9ACTN|nr:hypothetical protein [Streptomyces telluris]MCQ8774092.1 hypothetical protein [Streptomyces telluris]NJP77438.1 hypothetical protein [Streptomyces telluris]
MSDHSERVPGYRQIRMAAPGAPVAAPADEEAWRAREEQERRRRLGAAGRGGARRGPEAQDQARRA